MNIGLELGITLLFLINAAMATWIRCQPADDPIPKHVLLSELKPTNANQASGMARLQVEVGKRYLHLYEQQRLVNGVAFAVLSVDLLAILLAAIALELGRASTRSDAPPTPGPTALRP